MRTRSRTAAARCLAAALATGAGCGGRSVDPDGGALDCSYLGDATPDGATGGACGADVDPVAYWTTHNGVFVSVNDLRGVGQGAAIDAQLVVRAGDFSTPTGAGGDCVQFAAGFTGDAARNAAPDEDLGFADAAECEGHITFRYASSEGRYQSDAVGAGSLESEYPVVARFASGGALIEAASAQFPPAATFAMDPFHALNQLSTAADNTVTFEAPYGTDEAGGLAAVVVLFDPTDTSHTTVCAVPACRGAIHIPAALVAAFGAGGSYVYGRGFARSVPFTVAGHDLRLVVSSYAVGSGVAQ